MLPAAITHFVEQLINETRTKIINWKYISDSDEVNLNYKEMKVNVGYEFDFNQEVGVYKIQIAQSDGRVFYFAVSEFDAGYINLKNLYSEAQASDFHF
ncbi:Uncharacterised protein [Providencia rustigianii]|uniref:Uncharacterized protein n=5 Tax=Providencia rustigianii TaxID=158850 RepID=D1P4D3_9GAMM|nr:MULTISPECIES: hypothetical protein [Providencia]EFB71759.1 hypothetical protein PROVRUST_07085 [Providencia rustigianii DSM 4541]MTC55478.1 hypothetical protein [Providencia rustigianii]SPY78461.1 Uncharacterised protein [Providencia rustigianii]SUC28085.1 Uncharacterised protein [Providencia rustigianii]SUC36455.1 Uncharacterised protein [Providencia rustigianii]